MAAALVAATIGAVVFAAQRTDGANADDRSGVVPTAPPAVASLPSDGLAPAPSRPTRLAFFGDSIAVEADPALSSLLAARGIDYRFDGFGGTATCDYLDEMRANNASYHPDAVVLLFTGNALTPCMTERTGGDLGLLEQSTSVDLDRYLEAYEHDTMEAIDAFDASTPVYLVGPLVNRWGRKPAARRLGEVYERVAREHPNVRYLSHVERLAPGGSYADELPCAADEPCVPGQLVRVRAADGGHLCPEAGFCYGGRRLASTIVDAIGAGP